MSDDAPNPEGTKHAATVTITLGPVSATFTPDLPSLQASAKRAADRLRAWLKR